MLPEQPRLVVVVEDNDISRSALGRLLRASGFEPVLFDSAEAFLATRLNRAPYCVIVDVHLTGMSGIDLQNKLRRQRSGVPVVVTTADRAQVIRERAEQIGCAAFLFKPFTGDAILSLLASMARPSHA
jgi:FixJ family two-component response regulator